MMKVGTGDHLVGSLLYGLSIRLKITNHLTWNENCDVTEQPVPWICCSLARAFGAGWSRVRLVEGGSRFCSILFTPSIPAFFVFACCDLLLLLRLLLDKTGTKAGDIRTTTTTTRTAVFSFRPLLVLQIKLTKINANRSKKVDHQGKDKPSWLSTNHYLQPYHRYYHYYY